MPSASDIDADIPASQAACHEDEELLAWHRPQRAATQEIEQRASQRYRPRKAQQGYEAPAVIERLNNEPQRRIHGALLDALLRLELAGAVLVEARSELHVGERSYLSECAIVLLADSTEIRNEVATLASFTA